MEFASVSDGIKYFVGRHGNDMLKALSGTQIYFPVAVAQKCLESGFGTSQLAINYKNFGGIMNFGGRLPGAAGVVPGNIPYAIFSTPKDCFEVYANVLRSAKQKYVSLGLLTAASPQDQLRAIANGGYCEDPKDPDTYYNMVNSIMKKVIALYPLGKIA